MSKTWVYSDPHFYHKNIVTFTNYDDTRYYCACVEHTNFRPKLLDEILHERGLK